MQRYHFRHDNRTLSYLDAGEDGPVLIALPSHWMEGVTIDSPTRGRARPRGASSRWTSAGTGTLTTRRARAATPVKPTSATSRRSSRTWSLTRPSSSAIRWAA